MQPIQLENAIAAIIQEEPRFAPGAYFLVRESLDFTVDRMAEENDGEKRHVTGPELLIGFRDYALKEYGPMAATLLEDWGLKECRHVGEIVFLFIEHGVFGKQDSDTIDDFSNIYEFSTEFTKPFLPKGETSAA
ncbi:MAG: Minf_1886 family protein [Verrucomicrobiaceae bacterium]